MKKFLSAVGMSGVMLMSAVPASAAPNPDIIPSVQVDVEGAQGAEHACDGLRRSKGKNREAQLERHGCTPDTPAPPTPVTPEPEPEPEPVISDS